MTQTILQLLRSRIVMLPLLTLLQLLDIWTTHKCLSRQGTVESNPILARMFTKFMRSVAPTETTRRWRRGEVVGYYNAGATAGTQIGWVCTLSGSPGTWRTIVG